MAIDKVKKFGDLAYEYIRKKLIKPGKGGITSLPNDKEITNEMLQMFEKLRGAGYNVTNIGKEVKNADDLGFLINRIDQAEINQAKQFSDSADALDTIQFKLNNNIPLNPDDEKKLLGKGFKTTSDAFKGFEPKIIQGGKSEGIEQLLKSGDVKKGVAPKTTKETIERKSMIDPKLTQEENIKNMMKENKAAAKRLEEKMKDPDKKAMGGRIGMVKGGGILKFLSENNPFQAYKKYLQSVKRRSIEGDFKSLAPELGAVSAGGILVNRKMKSILEEGNELQKERFLKEYIEELNNDPSYDDRPELKDKLIENYTESLFGEKRAMGGRIGFKEGSGMTRRTFLKLLGGLASIPFVGKFLKPAAKVAKTAEIAKQSGVPAYFPKLVEKIQMLGNDVTKTRSTGERQVVKEYKNYELTEELDTGKLTIKRDNYTSEEYLQFEPGGSYYDETRKKEIKYPTEYEEVTVKPDYEGKMKDVDFGLDNIDEIKREVGESKIKKSGGGLAYMMGE
jgi:hypothetical protein